MDRYQLFDITKVHSDGEYEQWSEIRPDADGPYVLFSDVEEYLPNYVKDQFEEEKG